jgi:hypothetical protein
MGRYVAGVMVLVHHNISQRCGGRVVGQVGV